MADRLRQALRGGDTVARFGGDEFIVLATGLEQAHHASHLADKILQIIRPPFPLTPHELHVTTSVGVAVFPEDAQDLETLMKNADDALYRAKERGRNGYQLYSPAMSARAARQLTLEGHLRRAIDRLEFVLHYQPQLDLDSDRIVGVEALVRWQPSAHAMVLPRQFIPVTEEAGLIDALGEWVLLAACRQHRQWHALGLGVPRMAVNVSPRQLEQKTLIPMIERVLTETTMRPDQLELELTEGAVMANPEAAARTLRDIQAMGVHIAIDDFGTGHSSLAYLTRFPVDALKIDQSYVREISARAEDATIVRTIVSLAHSLGMTVVAEGVETRTQLDFLRAIRCEAAQGHLLGRPMTAEALEAMLRTRSSLR